MIHTKYWSCDNFVKKLYKITNLVFFWSLYIFKTCHFYSRMRLHRAAITGQVKTLPFPKKNVINCHNMSRNIEQIFSRLTVNTYNEFEFFTIPAILSNSDDENSRDRNVSPPYVSTSINWQTKIYYTSSPLQIQFMSKNCSMFSQYHLPMYSIFTISWQ